MLDTIQNTHPLPPAMSQRTAPSHQLEGAPDATLLELAKQFAEARHQYEENTVPYYDAVPGPPPEADAALDEIVPVLHELVEEMAEIQATTLEGMRAKAKALMSFTQRRSDGSLGWTNHDELLGWSLARDLLGRDEPPP